MSKAKPEMSSQEAKEKLKAGETLKGVKINRLTLGKQDVDYPIHIVECEIETLDFNKATLHEDVTIRRCKIDMCVLSEAKVEKKFDMKRTRIQRGRFQRVTFEGPVLMAEAQIGFTSFHQSSFGQKADFSRCTIHGDATFTETTFHGMLNVVHTKFEQSGLFTGSTFHDKADFKQIQVARDLELLKCTFYGPLLLQNSVIQLSVILSGARLEAHTDFSKMTAGRSLSLTGVTVGEKQGFRFNNARANPIMLERDVVEGHVFPENEGEYLKAAREYGFLRTTFESINRFEDEDWAYYNFKRNQRRGRPWSYNPIHLLSRFGNYAFLDIGCGYGTKPLRTLVVCAIMILFFASFYLLSGVMPVGESYGFESVAVNKVLHAINTSLLAFSGSYGDVKVSGLLRLLAMTEYLLGVVFMGLFVVAFSRKVIR